MSIYEINVKGYDCYIPVWFEKDCTKEEFEVSIKESIHECLPDIFKENTYISGRELLDAIVVAMEKKGFKKMKPDMEISLHGECLYSDYSDHGNLSDCSEKPEAIFEKDWKAILKHNKEIDSR